MKKNRLLRRGKKVLQCFLILLVIFPLNLILTPQALATNMSPTPPLIPPLVGEIIINEIMPDPFAVYDDKGEWFEIYNKADHQINLIGCIIKDNGSNLHIIDNNLIIDFNSYAVLARNSTSTENGGVNVDYEYSSFILDNSEDEIIIICNNLEIDRVEYNSEWTIKAGKSMILSDFDSDNNIADNWCLSTSFYGDGDLGTPGIANDLCEYSPVCGNNILDDDEKCDDENIKDGDGCSSDCQIESIYGYKFNDLDKNGIYDDEPKMGDWIIELYDNASSTDPIATTTTATATTVTTILGHYSFNNLEAEKDYWIKEVSQDRWTQTTPTASTTTINLASSTATTTINFGNWEYKTISGYKYYDKNRNGKFDNTDDDHELGIGDWTITLTNSSTTATTTIATTTTNELGYYKFENLDIGNYKVTEIMPDNWYRTDLLASSTPTTTPFVYEIKYTATTTAISTINFGNWQTEISGYKFNDENKNGEFDEGEQKMADWEIELFDDINATSSIASTTTDSKGNYIFKGYIGDYWVKEVQREGWIQTNLASTTATTTISTTTPFAEVNFGNWEYKTISGYKYNDLNRDGEWDSGEIGIGGWTIKLTNASTSFTTTTIIDTATTSTTTLGSYKFNELEPGVYIITEIMQTNWMTGTESVPTTTPTIHEITITATSTIPTSTADINFYNWQYNCVDNDGDGYYSNESETECGEKDCDDNNADINPSATEICGNDIDENCDGKIESCGGGGSSNFLYIHSENSIETESKIIAETKFATEIITWHTNKLATSRVVYGISSVETIGEWPNLGYQYSTIEDLNKTTFHKVIIDKLIPNTTYYFRTISAASPAIFSKEMSFMTPELEELKDSENEIEEIDETGDNFGDENKTGNSTETESGQGKTGKDGNQAEYQNNRDGEGGIIGEGAQAADGAVLGEKLALTDDLSINSFQDGEEKDEVKEIKKEQGTADGEKVSATSSAISTDDRYNCWNEWWWLIILLLLIIAYFAYENYRLKEENKESGDNETSDNKTSDNETNKGDDKTDKE